MPGIEGCGKIANSSAMLPHLTLQTWWSKTSAGIDTRGASDTEVIALETRYNVTLPHDFRVYLREASPAAENWDTEDGNWWPVSRIKNIPDEYKHSVSDPIAANAAKHLFFLDYSIWCWAWAISCADDETRGKVALIGGTTDAYVADSFGEFVDRYSTDWGSISRVRKAAPFDRFWKWVRGS